jgi:type IV pilus assembly protein PilA
MKNYFAVNECMRKQLLQVVSVKGFTLVELLIVIAIIGVLAAIVVPNVTGLIRSGQPEASSAELAIIQSAMDTMMTKMGLTSVTAVSIATNNMATFPDEKHPLYPDYLRSGTTKNTYTCTSTGLISQKTASPTATVTPTTTLTSTATPTIKPTPTSTTTKTPPPPVNPYQ